MERFELSQELGREILDTAKAKGASQGDVVMAESDSFFVTVRMGEVEKISQAGEKRLGLRLFFGNSSASASTSDISRKSIEKLVDDTARMARVTAQDPHGGLPEAADLARELPQLDLLDEPARAVSVDEKIQIALDTENGALTYDASSESWNRPKASALGPPNGCCAVSARAKSKPVRFRLSSIPKWRLH